MNVKTTITCNTCKNIFDYAGSYVLEETNERAMGKELLYEDLFVDEKGPHCSTRIKGSISYWEYPQGTLNCVDSHLTNGKAQVTKK